MKAMRIPAVSLLLPLLFAAFTLPLHAQVEALAKWTNPEGKVIEAEFVEMTDQHVVLKLKGQEEPIKVAHDKLSAASLEQAKRLEEEKAQKAKELAEANKGKFKFGEHMLPRGKKTQFMLTISSKEHEKEISKFYSKPTTQIKVTLMVPENFNPADKDSLVVICHISTRKGQGLNEEAVEHFGKGALEENALVVAVDGEFGNPGKMDVPAFRYRLIRSFMDTLEENYPIAEQWRYIHAGHSGGCGYVSYCGIGFAVNEYRMVGCFLSGGSYSPLLYDESWKLPNKMKKQMRLFYSFGKNDPINTPALQDEVVGKLKRSPYEMLRVVYHMDQHRVHQPHWSEALQWFKEPLEP